MLRQELRQSRSLQTVLNGHLVGCLIQARASHALASAAQRNVPRLIDSTKYNKVARRNEATRANVDILKAQQKSQDAAVDTSKNADLTPEQQQKIDRDDEDIVKSALGTGDEGSKPAKKPKKEAKKLTLWEKVKKEAAHYRDGTKLLGFEIKVSFKLALKMAAGHELSRREWRQLKRTVQDLVRLVPFSAFVLVPFAELLLPVALKIFPNMLPSTYEGAKAKEAKSQKLTTTREGVSVFLRKTIQESGLPISTTTRQREEFIEFFKKVRTSGEAPSRDDIASVCRIFKDDLTLDNLSRPQLVAMCRYMNLGTFGTDALLRYNVRHKMTQIKRDDKAIAYEGVTTLSVPELHSACQSRGIRTQGVSPGHLRDELKQWLDLRLKHRVPSTLLILSNAFSYGHKDSTPESRWDALVATLSGLPEELYHEAELEVSNLEGAATNKQRLDVLREQADLIEEEAEQEKSSGSTTKVQDREDLDRMDDPEPLEEKPEAEGLKAQK
ncbi:MRS7 family protein [Taphrina deformans PYCC 5710]|uniref:MRS7 family protein n=1 Tax=Taphrina deformans (strain PYCC 5710 / ATCC 11124 / CBS 356.35 / IMI 108563 / JCM 9778 / NBRC 8474) TaxID=1097556 RepID=R4X865_TAPDE|nr:MRS7 family protein [Taphrina deformans PYCC 5710]|eukprot:CCG81688.1 MRS7 family protein [Taphrina deformans PYCC 5710]